ncbi:MAG: asparaginase [Candidatus Izemoplasmatales bacterium]|jgi:L-asparaginase|nr:asparaginase [Candidatus Izemoplasmatales bacterium]
MKKIYMIFTGGTISMKIDDVSHTVKPALSAKEIMQSLLHSELYHELEVIEFSEIPSPSMTPIMMLEMTKLIQRIIEFEDPIGFVIIHGTDTLEETAFFIDSCIDTDIPIVVTGSMKSSSELGFDGINNLVSSILVAKSTKSHGRGVLVVMNDQINAASEVTKSNTLSLDTFKSLDYGPLGIVDNKEVLFHRNVTSQRNKLKITDIEPNVYLLKSYSGSDSLLIDYLIEQNAKGIVIEALGRGNLPPLMIPGIEKALKLGVSVIITSRCPSGRTLDSYGYIGGGKYLTEMGCIMATSLNGQKARLLLMQALTISSDSNFLKGLFTI